MQAANTAKLQENLLLSCTVQNAAHRRLDAYHSFEQRRCMLPMPVAQTHCIYSFSTDASRTRILTCAAQNRCTFYLSPRLALSFLWKAKGSYRVPHHVKDLSLPCWCQKGSMGKPWRLQAQAPFPTARQGSWRRHRSLTSQLLSPHQIHPCPECWRPYSPTPGESHSCLRARHV